MSMPWKPLLVMLICFAAPLLLLDNCKSVPHVVQIDHSIGSELCEDDFPAVDLEQAEPVEFTADELFAESSTQATVTWSVQNIRSNLNRCPAEGSPISGFVGPDRLGKQQGNLLSDLSAGRTDFSTGGFSQDVSMRLPRGCQAAIGGDNADLLRLETAIATGRLFDVESL
jgi:hypothetical protein